jgi:hypothetical protein
MQLLPGFIVGHARSMGPAFLGLIPKINGAFGHWPTPRLESFPHHPVGLRGRVDREYS